MPSFACASGEARVTSTSSNMIRPPVGARSPATQLKKVDFPAPFGPIRPTISPDATSRSAPYNATKLPKARVTCCALRSMSLGRRFQRARMRSCLKPAPEIDQPSRLEARQYHDDAAVQDVREAGTLAAEHG